MELSETVLGVIDVQPDFMPGGPLAVPAGDQVVAPINRLLGRGFAAAFATQDWHPPGHHSFASAHPHRLPFQTIPTAHGEQVLWPDHCIAGTPGAALAPGLDQRRLRAIIRKGMNPAIDSYSAFFENDRRTPTGLEGYLRRIGARRLALCGLALDYCVAWSAEDAARLGFAVTIVEDACRAIALPGPDGDSLREARARLAAAGVRFTTVAALDA
ncbi:MAG: bifunctional nicotinamidase/pyrazinamidase [Acetobacteraceae bacterium]